VRALRRALAVGEAGQALVLAVVMLPLFLAVVGLAIDGGVVFEGRRELQNAADAAARAGAMQVDLRAYRESAGRSVVLDPDGARQVAAEYLAAQDAGITAVVRADTQRVVVEVSREVPTAFLRIAGIATVRAGAIAPAELRHGVERGEG
jgi:Flp pilus assembly protein TadG